MRAPLLSMSTVRFIVEDTATDIVASDSNSKKKKSHFLST